MTLTRERAEELGFQFDRTDDFESAADPDVAHFSGDITRDGHTIKFQGRDEEQVLAQVEGFLRGLGEIDGDFAASTQTNESTSDSDVHDARDEGDNPS